MIDVWCKKVDALNVEDCEEPKLAGNHANKACMKEQISKRRKQPLFLDAENVNALTVGCSKDCGLALWWCSWKRLACLDFFPGERTLKQTYAQNYNLRQKSVQIFQKIITNI